MDRVILVVDMVRGFHDLGNLANPRVAKIIPNIKNLLVRSKKWGDEIIFLRDCHEPDDKEFKMFPKHCVRGTEETHIVKEFILPGMFFAGSPVLDKTRYSGFYKTDLEDILKNKKPKMVVVVGVCTDICVLHTVADLRNRDYTVVVPLDCVETFDAPGHPAEESSKWALNHMTNILGAVTVPQEKLLG